MVNGDPLPSKGLLIDSQGPWHKSYDVNIDIDIKIDIVIYIYLHTSQRKLFKESFNRGALSAAAHHAPAVV